LNVFTEPIALTQAAWWEVWPRV